MKNLDQTAKKRDHAPRSAPRPRLARGTGQAPSLELLAAEDTIAIVHDLRGPLSVIALEVSMLEESMQAGRFEAKYGFKRIARNIHFLEDLLGDLLDMSALGASHFEVDVEANDLCAIVVEVADRVLSARDCERTSISMPSSPVVVMVDARRIQRVIANLLQNAVKYSPRTGAITLHIATTGGRAIVSVTDEGSGIGKAELTCVFEKFGRADHTHKAGFGLGLYVSRAIVEAHGGRIGVESELGRGSRFFFDLPLPDAAR